MRVCGRSSSGAGRRGRPRKPYNRAMDAEPQGNVLVGVVMGSRNDYAVMRGTVEVLKEFGVTHAVRVIVAGAGGAAHLPGMIAAKTVVPVLGVPIPATALQGFDSLLSIVQMPKGVPVGTLAIGASGAMNAGLLAVAMLATTDAALQKRLVAWRAGRRDEVLAQVVGEDEVGA